MGNTPDLSDWVVGNDPSTNPTTWTDETAKIQAYFDACAANGWPIRCEKPLACRVSSTVTIASITSPAPTIGFSTSHQIDLWNLMLCPTGSRNRIVLDIGSAPGGQALSSAMIRLPRVIATGTLQWPATLQTNDTAIRIRSASRCTIYENVVYGFTKGIEYSGVAYSTILGGLSYDCRYGRVWTTSGATINDSFCNQNAIYGGGISCTSVSNGLGPRQGDTLTWDKNSSYRGHNNNHFHEINYELGSGNPADAATPVYLDGVGAFNSWNKCRTEGNVGPVVICDGGGSAGRACLNSFEFTYNEFAAQGLYIRNGGGAHANVLKGPGSREHHWTISDMGKLLKSAGGGGAYLMGCELFMIVNGMPARVDAKRLHTSSGAFHAHRNAILMEEGGFVHVGVALDASCIKDFICSYETLPGLYGRPFFLAFDPKGNLLSDSTTDSYGSEQYVKGAGMSANLLAITGDGYSTGDDSDGARTVHVTVREEVKELWFMVRAASTRCALRSMSVTGLSVGNKPGSAYPKADGINGMRVFSPVEDDGAVPLASADPGIAGILGYFQRGQRIGNSGAASGQPVGWVCTTAGYRAPAWAGSTKFDIIGTLTTNDSGKVYELTTPGDSASSGGPTGATAMWDGITDGTCKWRYVGVLAAFTAEANLA